MSGSKRKRDAPASKKKQVSSDAEEEDVDATGVTEVDETEDVVEEMPATTKRVKGDDKKARAPSAEKEDASTMSQARPWRGEGSSLTAPEPPSRGRSKSPAPPAAAAAKTAPPAAAAQVPAAAPAAAAAAAAATGSVTPSKPAMGQFSRPAPITTQFTKPPAAAAASAAAGSGAYALVPASPATGRNSGTMQRRAKDDEKLDTREGNAVLMPVTPEDMKNDIFISNVPWETLEKRLMCKPRKIKDSPQTYAFMDKCFPGRNFVVRSPCMSVHVFSTVPQGNVVMGNAPSKLKHPPKSVMDAKWNMCISIRALGPHVDQYGCDPTAVEFMRQYARANRWFLTKAASLVGGDKEHRDLYLDYCFECMTVSDPKVKNLKKEDKEARFNAESEDQKKKWMEGWISLKCYHAFARGEGEDDARTRNTYTDVDEKPHPDLKAYVSGYVVQRFKNRDAAMQAASVTEAEDANEEIKEFATTSDELWAKAIERLNNKILPRWNNEKIRIGEGSETCEFALPVKLPLYVVSGDDSNPWRKLTYAEQTALLETNSYVMSCEFVFKPRKPSPPSQKNAVTTPGLAIELRRGEISRSNMASGSSYHVQKVGVPPFALKHQPPASISTIEKTASLCMDELAVLPIALVAKGSVKK